VDSALGLAWTGYPWFNFQFKKNFSFPTLKKGAPAIQRLQYLFMGHTDGRTDTQTDGHTDGRTHRRSDGHTDGWTHRRSDTQTDGHTDARTRANLPEGTLWGGGSPGVQLWLSILLSSPRDFNHWILGPEYLSVCSQDRKLSGEVNCSANKLTKERSS